MEAVEPVAETHEEMPTLRVHTLLSDDPRRPQRPGDDCHRSALEAFQQRDTWTAYQHGAFWTVLLRHWPPGGRTGGRPPTTNTLSRAAALLARQGIDPAAALNVSPHTLRARERPDGHRERPSVERGEELLQREEQLRERFKLEGREHDYGTAMRRSVGELWVPEEAAPRVYADGEPEPELTYFNPLVVLPDDYPGAEYERAAMAAQHARWNEEHPDALPAES
jgi:hypothetical protein